VRIFLLVAVLAAGCGEDPPVVIPDGGSRDPNFMPGRSCGSVLMGGVSDVGELAVDATHVFFARADRIGAVPKNGGAGQDVVTGVKPLKMTTDSDSLYFVDAMSRTVQAVARADGARRTVSAVMTAPGPVLVAAGARVAFADGPSVRAADKAGGGEVELAQAGGPVTALSLRGQYLLVGTEASVVEVPLAGGPARTVLAPVFVRDLAGDDARAYFASYADVRSVALQGGAAEVIAGATAPERLAMSGGLVWWTDAESEPNPQQPKIPYWGTISRLWVDTGVVELLCRSNMRPAGLTVDPTTIYYSDRNKGEVRRIAR
jgi:hypothetical protein